MRRLVDPNEPGEVCAGAITQSVVDDQIAARRVAKMVLQCLKVDMLATMCRGDPEQIGLSAATLKSYLEGVARQAGARGHVQRAQRGILGQLSALR